ncbi:MAG: rod shape-determining protein MreC [Nitrospirae bacterium]|nr:MAG: rod shape-determining protein MreC [Nitrospirota bacterium]
MSRKKALLPIVVIISFILMTYQSKKGHFGSPAQISSLLDSAHKTIASLTGSLSQPFKRLALREEENTRLRQRVDELLLERDRYLDAVLENKRLKELLKLQESSKTTVAAARVVARGTGHWEHTLVLDKGLKDGVAKDMTVITPMGLAGKIISVTDSFSRMLLLSDINFSAAVRVRETRKEGVLAGTGTRTCMLKYVPYEEEIKTGDVIATSGLDSLFVPGVPVGYVSKVDNKGLGGNFQYIELTPFQDSSRIEEVLVIR